MRRTLLTLAALSAFAGTARACDGVQLMPPAGVTVVVETYHAAPAMSAYSYSERSEYSEYSAYGAGSTLAAGHSHSHAEYRVGSARRLLDRRPVRRVVGWPFRLIRGPARP